MLGRMHITQVSLNFSAFIFRQYYIEYCATINEHAIQPHTNTVSGTDPKQSHRGCIVTAFEPTAVQFRFIENANSQLCWSFWIDDLTVLNVYAFFSWCFHLHCHAAAK